MAAAIERTHYGLFINGEAVESESGKRFTVLNPATNEELITVAQGTTADVDRAVAAARAAFERGPWSKMAAAKRAGIIWKIADLLRQRTDEFARAEALNAGKAISSVKAEIGQCVQDFEFYAGLVTKITGETTPIMPGYLNYTVREPVGVCAQIVPWNYPLLMACWKLAPALAAGCAIVLKPASLTPLTALMMGELCLEAGVPAGVVNVICGPGATVGAYLAGHPGVDKVAFTGETTTGMEIMATAAKTIKRVTLELGGKSPSLVFDDAPLDDAVNGSLWAIFANAGQSCDARSRLFVQSGIHDEFVARFVERAGKLRVGDPLDPKTGIGSLISRGQWERIDGYVKIGVAEGATLLCGGQRPDHLPEGNFYLPTVLADVRPGMRVEQEEIFGPVVTITRFETEDEAVTWANGTIYGLAGSVWTNNVARAHRVAGRLKSGTVTINQPFVAFPGSPFGGFKQSGFGRELALETIKLYTETKSVVVYTDDKPINPLRV